MIESVALNMKLERYTEIFEALLPPIGEWSMRNFHATFAVKGSKLIAIGINKNKTHSLNLRNRKKNQSGIDYSSKKLICSELHCLNKVKRLTNFDFRRIELINFRKDREGNYSLSKPCESCCALIRFCGVRRVYYTTKEGFEIQQF